MAPISCWCAISPSAWILLAVVAAGADETDSISFVGGLPRIHAKFSNTRRVDAGGVELRKTPSLRKRVTPPPKRQTVPPYVFQPHEPYLREPYHVDMRVLPERSPGKENEGFEAAPALGDHDRAKRYGQPQERRMYIHRPEYHQVDKKATRARRSFGERTLHSVQIRRERIYTLCSHLQDRTSKNTNTGTCSPTCRSPSRGCSQTSSGRTRSTSESRFRGRNASSDAKQ